MPVTPPRWKDQWFVNVRNDVLAGTVAALALIPEAIAFSIIADVDPKVGLYASFCIAVISAFMGGRPTMISAATGAMALLMITLVKEYDLQYLFAAALLTGVFQILFGWRKLGRYMRFVPRSVMIGFVRVFLMAKKPVISENQGKRNGCCHTQKQGKREQPSPFRHLRYFQHPR